MRRAETEPWRADSGYFSSLLPESFVLFFFSSLSKMYSVEDTRYNFSTAVNNRSALPSSASRFSNKPQACPVVPTTASQASIDNLASLLAQSSISKTNRSSLPDLSHKAKQRASARLQERREKIAAKYRQPSVRPSKRRTEVTVPVQPASTSAPAPTSSIPSALSRASSARYPSRIPVLSPSPPSSASSSRPSPPSSLRPLLPSRLRPAPARPCVKGSRSAQPAAASIPPAAPSSTLFPASEPLAPPRVELRAQFRRYMFLPGRPAINHYATSTRIPCQKTPATWADVLQFQPEARGQYSYCPARWHASSSAFYSTGFPGKPCDCHGPSLPFVEGRDIPASAHYYIPPAAWATTPAEADVDVNRPRILTFNEDVVFDFFDKWYMEAYGDFEKSTAQSTPAHDDEEIRRLDAESAASQSNAPLHSQKRRTH